MRGHVTRAPALIVCDHAGDLFYSAGPYRNLHQPQLAQEKTRSRFWKKNEGEWTGKVGISEDGVPDTMRDFTLTYCRL